MDLSAILTSVGIGLLATTSPCVLPLYPGFLAYISGGQEGIRGKTGKYFLGFFVLAGVLVTMLALGAVIAFLAIPVGRALSVIIPIADLVILLFGVLLLMDKNPFKMMPQIQVPILKNPYVNAFIYGMLYGPIALPCSGPLVVGIFAFSLTAGEALGRMGVFFWFGIGFGIPLLLLSLLSGATQRWITRQFARRARLINLISGLLLVGVAVYDLWQNWGLIQAYCS